MKNATKNVILSAILALVGGITSTASAQQLPGAHPYYLHALSDLRAARWFLYHQPGDAKVYAGEDVGIREIDAAIGEMKRAAIDDGKNINDHPNVDVKEHGSRLLKAVETLKKTHADVDREEDNPQVQGLKHRILGHIEKATNAAEEAHSQWLKEAKR
jgi:hypothetical protein